MSFKIPCGGFKLDENSFSLDENGVLSIPKPLTYDYMPEGYPSKSVETVTLMEEQDVEFALAGGAQYTASITEAFEIVEGQTYTVNWDGTEYECVCLYFGSYPALGNLSITGASVVDTGEPFYYMYASGQGAFGTLDTSASHTISVKTILETVTPMAEEFLPTISDDKLPTIPVIEFTTSIIDNIGNSTQPSFNASNLSYSEIYSIVEKGSFLIKDSSGSYYSPIKFSISSSGIIFVDILIMGLTVSYYAQLSCNANKNIFYRNLWWQIEATKK